MIPPVAKACVMRHAARSRLRHGRPQNTPASRPTGKPPPPVAVTKSPLDNIRSFRSTLATKKGTPMRNLTFGDLELALKDLFENRKEHLNTIEMGKGYGALL